LGLAESEVATSPLTGERSLLQIVADFERTVLEDALRRCRGDVAQVQTMLQTPRKTIYDKLAKYDIKPASFR
jgi:two-component system C4-dicarboxylate transport response regulator DctD